MLPKGVITVSGILLIMGDFVRGNPDKKCRWIGGQKQYY
jgi:hypothetical protein